ERKPINPNKPLFSRALRSHLMVITSKSGFSKLPKNNLTVSRLRIVKHHISEISSSLKLYGRYSLYE
ncbi:MAG: hypothetical protein QW803_11650, partial [Candidatus Methanomethylicia archaeon]